MKVNESQRFIIGLLVRICKRKLSSKLMVEFLQNPICLILSICLMIINYIVWGIYGENKDMESFEENLNPSVVALELMNYLVKYDDKYSILFIVSVNPYSLLFLKIKMK